MCDSSRSSAFHSATPAAATRADQSSPQSGLRGGLYCEGTGLPSGDGETGQGLTILKRAELIVTVGAGGIQGVAEAARRGQVAHAVHAIHATRLGGAPSSPADTPRGAASEDVNLFPRTGSAKAILFREGLNERAIVDQSKCPAKGTLKMGGGLADQNPRIMRLCSINLFYV